jgi:tetratricopeptide (TPR) repeat protein
MSGTAEPLCSVFLTTGILALSLSFTPCRVLVAFLLSALALLSKETAVVFPLLAMGLLFYQSEDRWSPKTYLKTWPFWLLTAFYLLARATVLNFNGFFGYFDSANSSTITYRCYTFLATLPAYLRLLVCPSGLHMGRNFPVYTSLWAAQVVAGLFILAAAFAGVAWKPRQRATPLAWGLLWSAAVLIPVSGILAPSDAMFYEHWMYLPTMGLALGVGESMSRLVEHASMPGMRPVVVGVTVVVACLFGAMTFEQNRVWQNPIALFTHFFASGEEWDVMRDNLGRAYADNGQYELAIRQFRLATAYSERAVVHSNSGIILLKRDLSPATIAEAMKDFQRALELDPDFYRADDALAFVYARIGDQAKESEYRASAAAIRKRLGLD